MSNKRECKDALNVLYVIFNVNLIFKQPFNNRQYSTIIG